MGYTDNPAFVNAMAFAARNFRVLPLHSVTRNEKTGKLHCTCGDVMCSSPGKHPFARLAPSGLKSATVDRSIVEGWFKQHASLNAAVTTDELLVVDIDIKGDGDATWRELEKKHGQTPPTWEGVTGSGGSHYFFEMPTPALGNSTKKLGPGIDTRGVGCYVAIAGSKHILGWQYHLAVDGHPSEVALAKAPAWLVEALKETRRACARPASYYRELATTPLHECERNEKLASLAGHLLDGLIDPGVVHEVLQGWNLGRCHPPLSPDEVERTVASIAMREMKKRGMVDG